MLAELIVSIASGMIFNSSGLIADRKKSYGWATMETPPSRLIRVIVSSAASPLGTRVDTPRAMICPWQLEISIPGIITGPSTVSSDSVLWSVMASPSSPAL